MNRYDVSLVGQSDWSQKGRSYSIKYAIATSKILAPKQASDQKTPTKAKHKGWKLQSMVSVVRKDFSHGSISDLQPACRIDQPINYGSKW